MDELVMTIAATARETRIAYSDGTRPPVPT